MKPALSCCTGLHNDFTFVLNQKYENHKCVNACTGGQAGCPHYKCRYQLTVQQNKSGERGYELYD